MAYFYFYLFKSFGLWFSVVELAPPPTIITTTIAASSSSSLVISIRLDEKKHGWKNRAVFSI